MSTYLNELLEIVNKDFYNVISSKKSLREFANEIADMYCMSMNIPFVKISYKKLEEYGSYDDVGIITINKDFLSIFPRMNAQNNFYFVYMFIDTLLHELRHHAQNYDKEFQKGILKNFIEVSRDPLVKCHLSQNYSYYLSPYELDARYYAYTTLKENNLLKQYYDAHGYAVDEINSANQDPFDLVGFIKDPFVRKRSQPLFLADLEKCVGQIAKNNNLFFIPNEKDDKRNSIVRINNRRLNYYFDKIIAPQFYEDKFLRKKLANDIENKVQSERLSFENAWGRDVNMFDDTPECSGRVEESKDFEFYESISGVTYEDFYI